MNTNSKIIFFLTIILLLICTFFSGVLGVYVGVTYLSEDQDRKQIVQQEPIPKVQKVSYEEAYVDVVDQTQDSVVSVIISKDLPVYETQLGRDIFGFGVQQRRQVGEEQQQIGAGTGFVVSSDGYIITNRHVVSDETAEYTVVLNDGESIEAEVVDRDQFLDIAVLKIDKKNMKYLEFADSDDIKVGQQVLAIGNTLGEFSNTVSSGIVSGMYRSIVAGSQATGDSELLSDLIQTDASISPGNSGGPLLNLNGEVIGVNVAVSQEGENIGFAITSSPVKNIVDSVKANGKIIRPYLGVRYQQVDEVIQEKNGLAYDYGAIIIKGDSVDSLAVVPGSPADVAGLVQNDIILEVDGVKLNDETSLQTEIQKHGVGDMVTLKVFSKDSEKEIQVKLEAFE